MEIFTEYYEGLVYQPLPRAPLLDPSIPMSYVMSAGLVQVESLIAQSKSKVGDRFVLVQKCFRHFDLDKIGADGIHLSLFEMPGAFVFGANDREKTIRQMWKAALHAGYGDASYDLNELVRRVDESHSTTPEIEIIYQRTLEYMRRLEVDNDPEPNQKLFQRCKNEESRK